MTTLKRTSILLALAGVLAVAGCGGDEDEGSPIPADTAQVLEEGLGETERRLANGSVGACEDILNDTQPRIEGLLASLPEDTRDRDALEQSFANLWELVDRECSQREQQEEETAPEPGPVPDETETETAPQTDTEEEPPPPEEDGDDGEEGPPGPPGEETLPPEGDGDSGGEIPGQGGAGGGVVGPGNGGEG